MPGYIKGLTEKQKAAMPAFAQEWIKKGLKTGETDWDTFDKYMPICYEKAGIPYPARIVRVASPIVGALSAAVAEGILSKLRASGGGAVDAAVRAAVGVAVDVAVGGAVGGAVDDAVDVAVRGAVRVAVDDAVRGAVDVAVRDAVGGAVGVAVDGAVDGAVGDAVKTAVQIAKKTGVSFDWHHWLGGQFWVGYGYYWRFGVTAVAFLMDVCKLKLARDIMERATAYRKVCESVNYIWPNRDFVMVCARPTRIEKDGQGRLHSTSGKAIEYPDGWGLYFLNGVRFDDVALWKSISNGTISASEVFAIENTEQRRVAYELMDKAKMLELPGLEVIHEVDDDGQGYKMRIISFSLPGISRPFLYLNCFCPSSGREYHLETQEKDCWRAKAASFGLPADVEWTAEY
jgi:hypothetical protein